jgi:transposase
MCGAIDTLDINNFRTRDEYEKVKSIIFDLWQQNQQYRRLIFGQKSERYTSDTPAEQMQFEGMEAEEQPTTKQVRSYFREEKPKKKHPGRAQLPEHLPREETVIIPDEVKTNPGDYEKIGQESTEELEVVAAKYWVRKTTRLRFKKKTSSEILIAPAPDRLFPKIKAGISVIVQLLVDKYVDHLPLYRCSRKYNRQKIEITEQTMVGWIAMACVYLEVLYNIMIYDSKSARIISGDETILPVLERGNPKTHRGYMFVYVVDKKYAIFDYRHSRSREGPLAFLVNFKGIFQSDGYEGYAEAIDTYCLLHVGCMAHARRKFEEAFKAGEKECEHALIEIGKLYKIERAIRNKEPEVRRKARQEQSALILAELKEWVDITQTKVLPKSPTGKACTYFCNQYKKLSGYLLYEEADIDNNECERTIRPMTIGRKNYLFAGSHEGAKRAAIIYSLALTCRMNKIDPQRYFLTVFNRMQAEPKIDLRTLLPHTIKF